MRGLTLSLTALLALSALGGLDKSAHARQEPPTGAAAKTYKIAVGDMLSISAAGIPEIGLSREVVVAPDGRISLPLVGQVLASGLTIVQLEAKLKKGLDKYYLRPGISVGLLRVNPERFVNVIGPGDKSGKIAMKDGWRVLDAMAAAGSVPTERLEFFKLELLRGATRIPLSLEELIKSKSTALNLELKENDTILVTTIDEAKRAVTVSGQVNKTGPVMLPSDGSMATVIALSGGFTPLADRANVQIERDGKQIIVDLTRIDMAKTGGEVLQIGDKLFVPENRKRFYLTGMVAKAGEQLYPDDRKLKLSEVLSNAQVPPVGADLKNIRVTRDGSDGKPVIQTVNVTKMMKEGDKSMDMEVLPGDTVTVPAGKQNNGMQGLQSGIWLISSMLGIFSFIRR
ncbi:MAG: polysaccharide biosynthesis/export family protein [Armatimonas sp.]